MAMVENDRSFSLNLKNRQGECYDLLFKMHGNRSNILLLAEGEAPILFRNKIEQDKALTLKSLGKEIDFSFQSFEAAEGKPNRFIPTLGNLPVDYLKEQGFDDLPIEAQFKASIGLYELMLSAKQFFICKHDGEPVVSLFEIGEVLATHNSALAASNDFSQWFGKFFFNEREKLQALRLIEKQIRLTTLYIQKTESRIQELDTATPQEHIADIIMANLHALPKGSGEVELFNFYNNDTIKVKLNPRLSPQEFAANLYRKGKNRAKEVEQLFENLSYREAKLAKLQIQLAAIEAIENVKVLRQYLKENDLVAKTQDEDLLPYREFETEGYKIWVGRNSEANDKLTQQYASKNDIWLHARSVAGSHVIIKVQAGKTVPKPVLERAAELAAWFSKGKTETLCPVIYTPKKFVRKVKGGKPGQVMVDKEEVIMVSPKL